MAGVENDKPKRLHKAGCLKKKLPQPDLTLPHDLCHDNMYTRIVRFEKKKQTGLLGMLKNQ